MAIYSAYRQLLRGRNYFLTRHYRKRLNPSIRFLRHPFQISHPERLALGDDFRAYEDVKIDIVTEYKHAGQSFEPKLVIGSGVTFNRHIHLACCDEVTIGDGCLFASNIYLSDHNHGDFSAAMDLDLPYLKQPLASRAVRIGPGTWIGEYVSILPGVELGRDCVVGAGSVVTRSFGDRTILAGSPARALKVYDEESGAWVAADRVSTS